MRISVIRGDITKINADAIVNPANSFGVMGGGVAAAIRGAGGAEIEEEAVARAPISLGKAVATTAGKLRAKFVIHAPTMGRPAERTSPETAEAATGAALELADELGCRSVAFPGMGTGVGGVPYGVAAKAMAAAVRKFLAKARHVESLILVGYNEGLAGAFEKAFETLL